jgi:hypothetical protein
VDLKVHVGWKVFQADRGLRGLHYAKGVLKTGRWLRATEINLFSGGGCRYPSGFHIFNDRIDAEVYRDGRSVRHPQLVVRQVKYRGVLAEGTHFVGIFETAPGVVARWMWIPRSEVK